jgi:hypothetical protein
VKGITFNLLISRTRQHDTFGIGSDVAPMVPLERLVIQTETYISRDPPEKSVRGSQRLKSGLRPAIPDAPLKSVQKGSSSAKPSSESSGGVT